MDVEEAVKALVHTAQPFEEDGAVVGITLDALRKVLAGHATHADVASTSGVMRLKILRPGRKS